MTGAWRRRFTGAVLAVSALLLLPVVAGAHPLGNFTVNQYSAIAVRADGIDVGYVLDMAEIPTAQLLAQLDSDESRLLTSAAAAAYQRSECTTLRAGLTLEVGSRRSVLAVGASTLSFPTGAAGLHTLRLRCRFFAMDPPVGTTVQYTNHNFDERVGWREVTAVGTTARLASSSVPAGSASAQLTSYPADLLTSPLDVRSASLSVVAGTGSGPAPGPPAASTAVAPRGVDQFTTAFVSLISRHDVDAAFVGLALALAVVLGGVHAFAPGHGKTLMAAYLVGQRGSLKHAAVLAGSVTVTHTVGVLALGVALSVSASFAPTQVYPLLGVASGLIVIGIGVSLLARAWRGRAPGGGGQSDGADRHADPHTVGHVHTHGGHTHSHGPAPPRMRGVLAVGFAGGMVPSPSALVVLVGGIALHRTWFAVLLVIAYGVGMALVLTGIGVALRHARTLIDRRLAAHRAPRVAPAMARIAAVVPGVTAAVVVAVGLGLTVGGATSL